MATKIIISDEDTEKINALFRQYNEDYNTQYKEFQERMKPPTKKFEDDVKKVFAP